MNLSKNSYKNNQREGLYDNYIALDWAESNAALAWMGSNGNNPKVIELESELKKIKEKLKSLRGKKILTIEETTTAHWLYVELKESVDRIVICDPYRNSLLSEGPKNDKIDARKLCILLRNGQLKEVYHSLEKDYEIRKLVSSYEDVVKAGVRVQNQRSALYRAQGLNARHDKLPSHELYSFIDESYQKSIDLYFEEKDEYEKRFEKLKKENLVIKLLCKISGIAEINAVKIYSRVIDGRRFENKYKYWAYCGLAKYDKESGRRSYGKKRPRFCRTLKAVYRQATQAAIGGKNDIRDYYEYLLKAGYPEKIAKQQVTRYIAKSTYAVMKNKEAYIPYKWRKKDYNQLNID